MCWRGMPSALAAGDMARLQMWLALRASWTAADIVTDVLGLMMRLGTAVQCS